jgi:dethiobiotin synthetase
MKVYFITGTDTGVGKTLASAYLCRHLSKLGKTAYVKPVQTGGEDFDVNFVKHVCGDVLDYYCPLSFKLAASPHLAAAEEGRPIDVQGLVRNIKDFAAEKKVDFLVVEGAGGISVPLTDKLDMAGLCLLLGGMPVVVTRSGLGTLNHTFLTLAYAKARHLTPSLIISGCSTTPSVIEKDNLQRISNMADGRVLFTIPQLESLDTENCVSGELPEIEIFL